MGGALVMVIVLVVVFPVTALIGAAVLAAGLGSLIKGDADAQNRTDDGPNEYLGLSLKEAETRYPRSL